MSKYATEIPSEELGYLAQRIFGVLGMRCEEVKEDPHLLGHALQSYAYALDALNNLSIVVRTISPEGSPAGCHFSIAIMGEYQRFGRYREAVSCHAGSVEPASA